MRCVVLTKERAAFVEFVFNWKSVGRICLAVVKDDLYFAWFVVKTIDCIRAACKQSQYRDLNGRARSAVLA